MSRYYIGETENLIVRFYSHNTGNGAEGTEDAEFRPYCIAAYISGLSHMTRSERMELEQRWKDLVLYSVHHGVHTVWAKIEAGRQVVEDHNRKQKDPQFYISLVETISYSGKGNKRIV